MCPGSWAIGLTSVGWTCLKYSPLRNGLGPAQSLPIAKRYDRTSNGVTENNASEVDAELDNVLE